MRSVVLFFSLLALGYSFSIAACPEEPWDDVKAAMESGDDGTLARFIGDGMVSLRLDGISQGRYSAEQAKRRFREFFHGTTDRKIEFISCGSGENRLWAEARFFYSWRKGGGKASERILLEFCFGSATSDMRLCALRSVST